MQIGFMKIDVLKYCKILYMLNKLEINKMVLKIFSNFM